VTSYLKGLGDSSNDKVCSTLALMKEPLWDASTMFIIDIPPKIITNPRRNNLSILNLFEVAGGKVLMGMMDNGIMSSLAVRNPQQWGFLVLSFFYR